MPAFATGISDQLARRPALLALVGLAVGLTATHFPINLLFAAAILLLIRRPGPLLSLSVGLIVGVFIAPPLRPAMLANNDTIRTKLVIDSVPISLKNGGVSFLGSGDIGRVEVRSKASVQLGDTVELEGKGAPLAPDHAADFLSRGLVGSIRASSLQTIEHPSGIAAWGTEWRSSFVSFCESHLPERDAAFLEALVFEQRSGLDDGVKRDLEQSGAVQIVSASGLHLFVLAWFLELLLARVPLPILVRQSIVLLLLGIYGGAAGFPPGACRALVASLLRAVAFKFDREYDALSAIGIFGVLYLLWRPYGVFDPGFQVTAVLGAGLAIFATQVMGTPVRRVVGSVVGWAVSLPLLANLFGVVSMLGLPVSIVTVLLLPVCMIGLLLAHAMSFVSPGLADAMLKPVVGIADILSGVIHFVGSAPWWGVRIPDFNGYWVALFYTCAVALWSPRARPAD